MSSLTASDLRILAHLFAGKDSKLFVWHDDTCHQKTGNSSLHILHDTSLLKKDAGNVLVVSSWNVLKKTGDTSAFEFIICLEESKKGMFGFTGCSFHGICNPDGSLRWMYPSSLRQPTFLNLYNAGTWRGRLYQQLVKLAFRLNLRSLPAQLSLTCFSRKQTRIAELISQVPHEGCSVFTGTVGVNRKCVIEVNTGGKTTHFIKVPIGAHSGALLENEKRMLGALMNSGFRTIRTPTLLHSASLDAEVIDNIKPEKATKSTEFTSLHAGALVELYMKNMTVEEIRSSDIDERILQNIFLAGKNRSRKELPGVSVLLEKLKRLHKSIDRSARIHFAMAHGDFTPWNMYADQKQLHVYDWELARRDSPLLFDLFHFIFQREVMLNHAGFDRIEAEIRKALELPQMKQLIEAFKIDTDVHYKLYLLNTISYYLNIYLLQDELHPQAYWMLETWEEAVNRALPQTAKDSQRRVFVRDFFHHLRDKRYALLKFTHTSIEDISELSDLDLLVRKEDIGHFLKLFRRQAGVMKASVYKKSYMTTVELFFNDQSFLSIDFIHDFRRKGLVYLDAHKLLRSTSATSEGIRVPDKRFCFEYTWLFYLLNGASMPERYRNFYSRMDFVHRGQVLNHIHSSFGIRSDNLEELFDYSTANQQKVLNGLGKVTMNSSLKKVRNIIRYLADTLRDLRGRQGLMITMTGVDGAGKSTIIEELSTLLKEKFRRKVVVIRHRPSLLPILSTLKHGKGKAEQISASNMPRTGSNKNSVSSAIRFAYYYSDYLLGQFYVYLRYVMRGYVVLYDRYYFDFIVDGKRSNIQLPTTFTRSLYRFLFKPDVNILLYAPVQDILKRKQELDEAAITELTLGYKTLFHKLSASGGDAVYVPIENTNKEHTMRMIEQAIILAA